MIVTDTGELRAPSIQTNYKECRDSSVFEKMEETLTASERRGWGLTAIQIGLPIRACIIRYEKLKVNMINPKIEKAEDPIVFPGEGCLSLPGAVVNTRRHNSITASWHDYNKQKEMRAVFSGTEAVIVQHEIDHMDGILITDQSVSKKKKIGRNEPCPCQSGKKYKRCCGR